MQPSELYNLNRTMSCEEIAQMIGVTKNSIVGKIYRYRQRMGLPPASNRSPFEIIVKKAKMARKVKTSTAKPKIDPQHKTLADLGAKDCRYPYGDKLPYTFCGQRQKDGSAYCEEHHELCRGVGKQWHEKKYK